MVTPDDLISTPPSGGSSTTSRQKQAAPERKSYILPKDIANSLSHLSDRDFGLLLKACMKEKTRRLPASSPRAGKAAAAATPLTTAQVNAVRAAFKAGVRPPVIARQFRLSQAQIREALATGKPDDELRSRRFQES
jgi:hypothetical protein